MNSLFLIFSIFCAKKLEAQRYISFFERTKQFFNRSFFIQNSPRQLSAKGREDDGDAIVAVMDSAQKFVHISVMDYIPATIYGTCNTLVFNFQKF